MLFYSIVKPKKLEWSKSVGPAINESYSISCSAIGYPAPFVYAEVRPRQNCSYNYTYQYVKVDNYRGKALITIPRVSMKCLSVFCHSGDIEDTQMLNVTSK